MSKLARMRKAIVTALGMAVTLVLLVPPESIPEQWRPWVGLVLALGTVAGVYRVRNDPPRSHLVAPTRAATEAERPRGKPLPTLSPPGETEPETPPRRRPPTEFP